MRVCDLEEDQIKVGMRIRSLVNPDKLGTVVKCDAEDDMYCWVKWDGADKPYGGFYGNCCRCEVV